MKSTSMNHVSIAERLVVSGMTIAVAAIGMWSFGRGSGQEGQGVTDSELQISYASWSGQESPRSLRGTGASWLSAVRLEAKNASAAIGSPLQTRVVALDALGRPAGLASCGQLKVNVTLSGHARVVQPLDQLEWTEGELRIDIVSDVVENVAGEIQIQPQGGPARTYSAHFEFVAGQPEDYRISLCPLGAAVIPRKNNNSVGIWPTQAVIEVALEMKDRFGNPASFSKPGHPEAGGMSVRPNQFTLRSNTQAIKILNFFRMGEDGNARARIRAVRPGPAELWLEHSDGFPLRDKTLVRLEVIGAAEAMPVNFSSAAVSSRLDGVDAEWQEAANEVRKEFLHAWKGYKKYAWGMDELMPLSKKGKDVFGNIGITILDSLSSLWLMGLPEEFAEAADWVSRDLDFAIHWNGEAREVSVFEVIIRALGGLLSAHTLSGQQVFLDRAIDLGDRLLPAFNTSSGMPLPRWDIARNRGTLTTDPTILAEAGSMQLEFRTLTALTGDLRYKNAADRATAAIVQAGRGLLPVHLTPPNQVPTRQLRDDVQMGALADSYYEYLLKQWIQSPSEAHLKDMWLDMMEELPTLVHNRKKGAHMRLLARTDTWSTIYKQDHLSCFTPGMIALGLHRLPEDDLLRTKRNGSAWLAIAEGLTEGCAEMWTHSKTSLAPEFCPVRDAAPHKLENAPGGARHSFLRPETAESLFYLYRATGKSRYRELGYKMFKAIREHAKVPAGYASVMDVYKVPTTKLDEMQSFVLSETFKYLYLLFSPASELDLDTYVLNTEGHPLPKLGPF